MADYAALQLAQRKAASAMLAALKQIVICNANYYIDDGTEVSNAEIADIARAAIAQAEAAGIKGEKPPIGDG